jgi:hypothetical protein
MTCDNLLSVSTRPHLRPIRRSLRPAKRQDRQPAGHPMTHDDLLSVGTSDSDQLTTSSKRLDPPDAEIDHRQASP